MKPVQHLSSKNLSFTALVACFVFVVVVVLISFSQPRYDDTHRFISELTFGEHGGFLWVGFVALSVAFLATAANFRVHRLPMLLVSLECVAAAAFFLAGFVTLSVNGDAHIGLVATGFVAQGVCMYGLPRVAKRFQSPSGYLASWLSGVVMCGSSTLTGKYLESGVAQRISALALLFWLCYVAWHLSTRGLEKDRSPAQYEMAP